MDMEDSCTLSLSFGLAFEDLAHREGLRRVDALFLADLRAAAPELKAGCRKRGQTLRRSPPNNAPN